MNLLIINSGDKTNWAYAIGIYVVQCPSVIYRL